MPFDRGADALDFAALDREQAVAAAFVALHELHLHAQQAADELGRLADAAAGAGARHQQFAIEELDGPLNPGGGSHDAHPAGRSGEPSHWNLPTSKVMAGFLSMKLAGILWLKVTMEVPSFGAALNE